MGQPVPPTAPGLVRWVLGRQRGRIVAGALAGIGWMGAGALLPVTIGAALDDAMGTTSNRALAGWSAAIATVVALQAVFAVIRHHCALWLTNHSQWSVEQLLTARVLDPRGGVAVDAGAAVSTATSDAEAIGDIANLMCRGVGAIVTFTVVAVVMLATSPWLGLLTLVGMPLSLLVLAPLWRPARERAGQLQQELAAASSTAADTVNGLRVVKGLGGERVVKGWFAGDTSRVRTAAVRAARVSNAWPAGSTVVPGLLLAAIIWVAGRLVIDGQLSPGELVAFSGLAVWVRTPLNTVAEVGEIWAAGLASARRITTVLNASHGVTDDSDRPASPASGLAFESVRSPAIDDLTVTIAEGEHVGLVCVDHRAATSIVELLGRERDPDHGSVALGGVDLRRLALAETRRRIAVEPHHTWLFAGTLHENLVLAVPDASRAKATGALATAAGDDLADHPDQLDRWIGERGHGLSGGQRQRVALARRLMGDPDVVVLHEPTSALDIVTERTVADRLRRERQGRTTILLTTSPALLAICDRVVVIDDGAVVTSGPHAQLLAADDRYRRLVGTADPDR